jgi:hypothetical protein
MSTKNKDIIMQNKVFGWIAVITAAILSIPLMAMKFQWVKPDPTNPADQGVSWTLSDFIIIGVLLFGASSLFVLVARVTPKKYRTLIAVAFVIAILYIWAELAVGIFTNLGS